MTKARHHEGAEEPVGAVQVNQPVLALLAAIATVVGCAPAALALGRPLFLLYTAGIAMFTAVVLLFYRTPSGPGTMVTYRPTLAEFVLAGIGAIAMPAIVSGTALGVYGLVYGVVILIKLLAAWLNRHMQLDADLIAIYPTVFFGVLCQLAIFFANIQHMGEQLYPGTTGIRSAFYGLITRDRRWLLGCITLMLLFPVGMAALAFGTLGRTIAPWFYTGLQLYLVVVTSQLYDLSTGRPRIDAEAVQAISKLFKACGYTIILEPRTGDSETDPLLVTLALFAHSSTQALAVEVKTRSESVAKVDWTAASNLRMASLALSNAPQNLGVTTHKVEPLMVLIGREPSDRLKLFSAAQAIRIVEIQDEDVVDQILRTDKQDDLQEMARQYLQLSSGNDGVGEASGGHTPPGGKVSDFSVS